MSPQGKHVRQDPRPSWRTPWSGEKPMETSKKLLLWAGVIFAVTVAIGIVAAFSGIDITLFVAVIGVTGGVFGSAIVSYENKAKMENIIKIKMAIIKFRLAISQYLSPEQLAQVENDIRAVEDAIDGKIDDTITQAVTQDAEISNF